MYLLVIEIFYTIFRFTGLNKEKARFQALSLLTTAGYTTTESEDVLTSKIRRKVAMFAMFLGYMFSVVIASSIISIVNGFIGKNATTNIVNVLVIVVAILVMFFITMSESFKGWINSIIKGRIERYIAKNQQVNPLYILDTLGSYVVCEVLITNVPEDLKEKTLVEAEVRQKYDVSVLALKRGNKAKTMDVTRDIFKPNDRVIVFSGIENIKALFQSDVL